MSWDREPLTTQSFHAETVDQRFEYLALARWLVSTVKADLGQMLHKDRSEPFGRLSRKRNHGAAFFDSLSSVNYLRKLTRQECCVSQLHDLSPRKAHCAVLFIVHGIPH